MAPATTAAAAPLNLTGLLPSDAGRAAAGGARGSIRAGGAGRGPGRRGLQRTDRADTAEQHVQGEGGGTAVSRSVVETARPARLPAGCFAFLSLFLLGLVYFYADV